VEAVVRIDEKGRLLIPKSIREAVGLKERQAVRIEVADGKLIIVPLKGVADTYYGAIRVKRWPRDLDEFLEEVLRE